MTILSDKKHYINGVMHDIKFTSLQFKTGNTFAVEVDYNDDSSGEWVTEHVTIEVINKNRRSK